jgi:hypothetical protein
VSLLRRCHDHATITLPPMWGNHQQTSIEWYVQVQLFHLVMHREPTA